jgi:hypothetical protein
MAMLGPSDRANPLERIASQAMADLQRIGAPVRLDAVRGLRLSSSISRLRRASSWSEFVLRFAMRLAFGTGHD